MLNPIYGLKLTGLWYDQFFIWLESDARPIEAIVNRCQSYDQLSTMTDNDYEHRQLLQYVHVKLTFPNYGSGAVEEK